MTERQFLGKVMRQLCRQCSLGAYTEFGARSDSTKYMGTIDRWDFEYQGMRFSLVDYNPSEGGRESERIENIIIRIDNERIFVRETGGEGVFFLRRPKPAAWAKFLLRWQHRDD